MKKKKLRLADLKVEPFMPDERAGVIGMALTQAPICGDTNNWLQCQSLEACPPSHPYQKDCV